MLSALCLLQSINEIASCLDIVLTDSPHVITEDSLVVSSAPERDMVHDGMLVLTLTWALVWLLHCL